MDTPSAFFDLYEYKMQRGNIRFDVNCTRLVRQGENQNFSGLIGNFPRHDRGTDSRSDDVGGKWWKGSVARDRKPNHLCITGGSAIWTQKR
jgi:hypothetical protein